MKRPTFPPDGWHKQIRTLVVDDHPLIRAGLCTVINFHPDTVVAAEAASGEEGATEFERINPDVTLMDLRLPGIDGIEAAILIRSRHPDARIIILSAHNGEEDIYRAFHAGAAGYLHKTVSAEELMGAIRAAHAGQVIIPPAIAQRLAQRAGQSELSHRELEVLRLMMRGLSNKEIGGLLFVSERTVKLHASNLFVKLKVRDRTEAVMVALQRGLVHMENEVGQAPSRGATGFLVAGQSEPAQSRFQKARSAVVAGL